MPWNFTGFMYSMIMAAAKQNFVRCTSNLLWARSQSSIFNTMVCRLRDHVKAQRGECYVCFGIEIMRRTACCLNRDPSLLITLQFLIYDRRVWVGVGYGINIRASATVPSADNRFWSFRGNSRLVTVTVTNSNV